MIGSKLKGKASAWFHSRPEHLELNSENLMIEIKSMFDHRTSKLTLRKEFEDRKWKNTESFGEYYHEKIILANNTSVDEEELVDYLIDGIPNDHLRNQARMQRFVNKRSLFEAFEKISLPNFSEFKSRPKEMVTKAEEKSTKTFHPTDESGGKDQRSAVRCFNCNGKGHMAPDCTKPKREWGTCFICGKK